MAENEMTIHTPSTPALVADDGDFSLYLDSARFEHICRVAKVFASSELVPAHFRNLPNAIVGFQMAVRLQIDPLMFMQNSYIVQGKPGIEAKLAIALINSSGLFRGPLQYRMEGEGKSRKCTAYATHVKSGEVCEAECSMTMAEAEGWIGKSGSKWKTIPELMLRYRAASFFGRLYCPERLMGMQTVEELRDVAPAEPAGTRANELLDRFSGTGEIAITEAEIREAEAAVRGEEIAPATCPDCGKLLIEGHCYNETCPNGEPAPEA